MALPLPDDDVHAAVEALAGRRVRGLTWHAEPLDPHLRIHSVTAGVIGVRGTADGEPFAMVVKQTRLGHDPDPGALWTSGATPEHRLYWKREYLAFATGLLGAMPGRLRAPRLYLATEPGPESAWIWFEYVEGTSGEVWELARFGPAARDLGTTQGAYVVSPDTVPDEPWLSRGWLNGWLESTSRDWPLVGDEAVWRDERLASLQPLRPRAATVLEAIPEVLAVAESAPRTLVHLDMWPANLISDAEDRTVAIDWSSVGIGGIAQDLDQVTLDPVWMQVRPGADLDELEQVVLASYAAGLRESGLDLSDAQVRRWYAAFAGARYGAMIGPQLRAVTDPEQVRRVEDRWSRPFAEIVADRARVIERCFDLCEEVLAG